MLDSSIKPRKGRSALARGCGAAWALAILCLAATGVAQESTLPEEIDVTPNGQGENGIQQQFNAPELPAPEALPEPGQGRATIIKRDRPVSEVFTELNQATGATVRGMGEVPGQTVSIIARDATVEDVLNQLASEQDWTWIQRQDGAYEVWDKQSFIDQELRGLVIRRIFTLRHVNAADVQAAVEGVLSEVGQIAVNPRTNELIVTDLPDKVALIESIIEEIDVPLYMRTFYVGYADFEQLREPLIAIKSEAGTIQFDPTNRRIIVTDTLENVREMEQLIDIMDVDRPTIAYYLSSIGLESADAEGFIEKFIVPIVSEGALVEFLAPQSTLVVQDVPEVHDRILNMLRVLDRAPKMIWIEGEILEVREGFEFEWGVEVTYDADLADAFDDSDIALPRASTGAAGLRVLDLMGNAQVALDAMMSDDSTVMLLKPRALVRNMQEVEFDLTQENPQITTFFNDTVTGVNSIRSSTITFVETGLSLSLIPTISNRGLIEMEIEFENSSPVFVQLNTGTAEGAVQDAVGRNTQRIRTVLIVPSGETRVLGGLSSNSQSKSKSGVPVLSQIPWIGALFGRQSSDDNKRVIYFFLTPTIRQEEPQVELLPVPINPEGRRWRPAPAPVEADGMEGGQLLVGDPAEYPEEAMPYMEQVRPRAFYEDDVEQETLRIDTVPPGQGRRLTLEEAQELLTSEAPPETVRQPTAATGTSGAIESYGRGGALGPSGTLSSQQGRVIEAPVRTEVVTEPVPAEAVQPIEAEAPVEAEAPERAPSLEAPDTAPTPVPTPAPDEEQPPATRASPLPTPVDETVVP